MIEDARFVETSGWRPWLIVLLVLLEAQRSIDEVVTAYVSPMLTQTPGHDWFQLLTIACEIVGFVLAGLSIDRFSVARVASLSMAGWAALTAMSAIVARTPLLLFAANTGALVAGVVFGLAVTVAVKFAFPPMRRARVLALLNIAATTSLVVGPMALRALHWPPTSFATGPWAAGSVPIAVGASILAGLAWRMMPRAALQEQGSLRELMALFRHRGVGALVLVMTCHMLALSVLFRVLYPYIEFERLMPRTAFMPSVAPPLVACALVQFAIAHWSDTRARRTRRPAHARTPFVTAGALLTAAVGLIPLVPDAGLVAVYWIVALGMAGFPLVFTLGVDIVPADFAGRFFGIAMALVLAIATCVFLLASAFARPTHSMVWYFYLAGLASLVGAAIAHVKLRQIQPVADQQAATRRLGEVFA